MRILFITGRRFPPDRHGGAQASAHSLLRRVAARGHVCEAAVVRAPGLGLHLLRLAHRLSGHRWFGRPDHDNGYPTWRVASWHIGRIAERRIAAFRPDVLVTDMMEGLEALPAGDVPVVLRLADVSFRLRPREFLRRSGLHLFANSRFIADALRAHAGIDAPVLYPIVEADACRAATHEPRTITFVNPIEGKGLDVALCTAERLSHRPFLFLSGWPRPNDERARLEERVARFANVQLAPWTPDIRSIYARTRILLFPAKWEEGFGRVVLEAHANRIPAVTSDRGGLPEAVGAGGRVLPYDAAPDAWAAAVESLMADEEAYAACAEAAAQNLARPEFDAESITDRFEELLKTTKAG